MAEPPRSLREAVPQCRRGVDMGLKKRLALYTENDKKIKPVIWPAAIINCSGAF